MLSWDILEIDKTYFCLQNSFSYSADVKPIINKNRFEFILCTYVYTIISMVWFEKNQLSLSVPSGYWSIFMPKS